MTVETINQNLNQYEMLPIRGLVSLGNEKNIAVLLDSENTEECYIGDFVTLDETSKMKGIVVRKAKQIDKVFGIITSNLKSDRFSNTLKRSVFAISPAGSTSVIYAESGGAFKRGDALELDGSDPDGLHRVIKKGANKSVATALEESVQKGDLVLINLT